MKTYNNKLMHFASFDNKKAVKTLLLSTSLFALLFSNASAYNIIGSQLDPGENNADVTNLQTYLATMPSIYPSGLVTGYFGDLTTAAVIKFQAQYGLAQVGRVGPATRDKLNNLISGGTVGGVVTGTANNTITTQLDPGENNRDVMSLQTFLSTMPSIYPSGLVTGYYGDLTTSAVTKFQAQYNLGESGRVGPLTRDKINSMIIANNGGVSDIVTSGPQIYSVNQNVTAYNATFTWYTDKMATGKIFYSTSMVTMNEGDMNSVGFGATSGFTATNDNIARTSQQVTISNLQANTLYYYVIVSTDLSGNVSVFGPNNTFRTNSQ